MSCLKVHVSGWDCVLHETNEHFFGLKTLANSDFSLSELSILSVAFLNPHKNYVHDYMINEVIIKSNVAIAMHFFCMHKHVFTSATY